MNVITKDDLQIMGGNFLTEKCPKFLTNLPEALDWAIFEYSNGCELIKSSDLTTPSDASLVKLERLERVRFFGAGGDLDIRRDQNTLFWRFVGRKSNFPAEFASLDFWQSGGIASLVVHEETLYLWGEWRGNKFKEAKVAAANLNYPISGKRAIIKTNVYSYYGRPQFSWYRSLEGLQ
ncbi:hypothetical protein [Desulfosporosinus sp. BICA1-9]|uniref:hypothetical protein n=1 Tax=Desulfosporosinus sp. BICA1-9 TaxID=1531958 RepID=UPI00054B02D3|nr:hypothetical protein [Desulfosporosinus sp. BICA1-9]KJS47032.1 MAG: hypothetical protein VR66_22015 [Peptococcaceae bacterium BRH_c23]KJS87118.1 MAG: hypothetical protein JL57_14870 [Desulfosporosinus sp. BICA1-9]HBW37362.1 hypothetical protein [Desulfosporosinus sp.]